MVRLRVPVQGLHDFEQLVNVGVGRFPFALGDLQEFRVPGHEVWGQVLPHFLPAQEVLQRAVQLAVKVVVLFLVLAQAAEGGQGVLQQRPVP